MRKIWHLLGQENSVRSASLLLMVTLALSNVLGLFRDIFLARNFTYAQSDIYFAAFRIPDTIFNFLILGAITSAFIPIFSDYVAKNEQEKGFRLTSTLINTAVAVMALMAVLFYFLMPLAMHLVVPSFEGEKFSQAVKLSRIMMMTPIFFSVSYIISGVLNSHKRFLAYAIAPLLYNLSIIVGTLLAPKFNLEGVAYAVVIGSFFHVAVQIPTLIKLGYRFNFFLDWRDAAFRRVLKLMVPRSVSLGVKQLLDTVYTAIGSTLALGSISAFIYSNNIQTVPIVIMANSFATVLFPTLSRKIAEGDKEGFSRYLIKTIRIISFLLIPTSILFVLFRAQIVRLILGNGKLITWDETRMTALTLGFFSISLLAQGLTPLLIRAFFALKNTKLPMYVSIATVAVSIFLAYPLSRMLSVPGLALAFSIGSFFEVSLLYYYLRKVYPHIWDPALLISLTRIVILSLTAGIIVWITMHAIANYVDMTRFFGVLTQFTISTFVGVAVYGCLSYLFGGEELKWILRRSIQAPSQNGVSAFDEPAKKEVNL